jgi:hypothetical protein
LKRFYRRFNQEAWGDCYALLDPQLTQQDRVQYAAYAGLMQAFKDAYGSVKPKWTRLSLHLKAALTQRDRRPFAYVYVLWQDEAYAFHIFRERWIKDHGQWYTRVVGLVPNKPGVENRSE